MTSAWLGAIPAERGFCFRLWAPAARAVTLHLTHEGRTSTHQLGAVGDASHSESAGGAATADGLWEIVLDDAAAGDRYAYSFDGRDPLPDPASRFQPDGVHGWSEVVDPRTYRWSDGGWSGLDPRRVVVYELHVGTFTPEGTLAAAAAKLPLLRDLGVTAIELMPVADFAGRRIWGYVWVALFAPSRAYGRPDDLRAFIDAAHRHRLAVLMDVVYNHLGPEGAYLPAFAPVFLTTAHETPWGAAVNLDGDGSAAVRRLLTDNALHWIREYHADGLRLDATHSLHDSRSPHFLAELTADIEAASDGRALVYAEDHRNLAEMLEEPPAGWGLDGVWADDFHHVVRRMLAGDSHGYYQDFAGVPSELTTIFRHGWLYTGQPSPHLHELRGTEALHVPLRKAVICIQNHDQIGNRALGDRLNHVVEPAAWRAATTLLLTAPMTPLLFMGQEWAASTPFAFFTDFEPGLGAQVVAGRRREFAHFPEFSGADAAERIPDPQADATFNASSLRWDERGQGWCARALALTRRLLELRAAEPTLRGSDTGSCEAEALGDDAFAFIRDEGGGRAYLVVVRLRGEGSVVPRALPERAWAKVFDTENPDFTDDPVPPSIDMAAGRIDFRRPGAVIFAT